MLTETAKVLSIENGSVNVETIGSEHCTSCSARSSCGHRLLAKLHPDRSNPLRVLNVPEGINPGDTVQLRMDENMLLRLSFLFYLLPLCSLIGFVMLAEWLGLNELLSIFAAFLGLGLGFVGLMLFTKANHSNPKFQASLLLKPRKVT